jgi:hypothetical protein
MHLSELIFTGAQLGFDQVAIATAGTAKEEKGKRKKEKGRGSPA